MLVEKIKLEETGQLIKEYEKKTVEFDWKFIIEWCDYDVKIRE